MCSIIGAERKKSNKSWWQCAAASSKGANRHDKVPLNGALKANRMWHFDYRREREKKRTRCTMYIGTWCDNSEMLLAPLRLLVPNIFFFVAESSVSAHIFFGFECIFRRLFCLTMDRCDIAHAHAITWWLHIDFHSAFTIVCVFVSFSLIHFFVVIPIFDYELLALKCMCHLHWFPFDHFFSLLYVLGILHTIGLCLLISSLTKCTTTVSIKSVWVSS